MENKLKITASCYDKEITLSMYEGSTIDELLDAFKVIAIGITFSHKQWEQAIIELAQELQENEKENIN